MPRPPGPLRGAPTGPCVRHRRTRRDAERRGPVRARIPPADRLGAGSARSGSGFDAGAAAGYQVAVGGVIPVEIDRTLVSGRQMEARRMAARQRLIALISGASRGVLGEILGEARVLREIPGRRQRRRPRPHASTSPTRRPTVCARYAMTSGLHWAGLNRQPEDSIVADDARFGTRFRSKVQS